MSALTRRVLLGTGAAGAAASVLAACGSTGAPDRALSITTRHYYGTDRDNQFGDLYLPTRPAVATAVLLHGGFWLDQYALDLMVPMAKALVADGWAVWNLEYTRLGSGGGWPTTFDDVARGVDLLAKLDAVTLDKVVLLGHSAGGHLAAWAASRTASTPGGASAVTARGTVSLAGVLDLTDGQRAGVGGGVIEQLLGGTPAQQPEHYALGDPTLLVPAPAPVVCLHGTTDDTVPADQSTRYVAADTGAGGTASYVVVPGDHFDIIDPTKDAWTTTSKQLRGLAGL